MFLILFVLNDETLLGEVLDAWEDAGVSGATVMASTGIGRLRDHALLRDDIPLIPSLADLLREDHEELRHRTLFSVVPDEATVERVVARTEAITSPLSNPNTGILAVLPVWKVYGLQPSGKKA